jgi:AraC family transcriptional regulator of adaptative response / DNA-3-methyladenine glycosylase II
VTTRARPSEPEAARDALNGLDRATLDRARLSRDARFDGRFYIAVTSTKIYCRPVCPAPTAKSANVRYYATAAAAAEAGFRPCLRCRPEAAPGTPAWYGTSAVVRRALRMIQEGLLDGASVPALAARVGVGPRHLHRLFIQHVGASPIAVAQTRRLHFAKRLLDETELTMTDIAGAAGFGSLRRFNDAFLRAYGRPPRELRRLGRHGVAVGRRDEVALKLAYRPPYDWAQVLGVLGSRAIGGIERVDERGYARTVAAADGHAVILVRPLRGEHGLELRVRGAAPEALFQIAAATRRVFDLAADPARIGHVFGTDPLLAPLVARRPGARIAGAWDPFECAVTAVLSEHVGLVRAPSLAARMAARLGRPIPGGADGLERLFPSAADLERADLKALGVPPHAAAALAELARLVRVGGLDFAGPVETVSSVIAGLPGCGPWAAQYLALHALAEPDAFPDSDADLRRAAAGDGAPLAAAGLSERAEAWRPWRGYAAVHLWCAAEAAPGRPGAVRRSRPTAEASEQRPA